MELDRTGLYTKEKRTKLTVEELKENVKYDKETGIFISKTKWGKRYIGKILGNSYLNNGYLVFSILGEPYMSHRLAWLYEYGEWPKGDIDHIDGNKINNAISNLRDVSRSENNWNQRCISKNNKSGLLGVCLHKTSGKYRSTIFINNKQISLGYYLTPEEAHKAYINAKRILHSTCTI